MEITGKGKKGVFLLAESVSEREDNAGIQLAGKSGREIKRLVASMGWDLEEDFWKLHAVSCHPPDGRAPTDFEIACCRRKVWKTIREKGPKVIIPLGMLALNSLLSYRMSDSLGTIERWRGWAIPDRDLNCWITPVFSYDYLDKYTDAKVVNTIWKSDFRKAIKLTTQSLPPKELGKEHIRLVRNPSDAKSVLRSILMELPSYLSFDYETTGLKPYNSGHDIACVGIHTNSKTWAMPMFDEIRPLWKKILQQPKIGKIAQDLKFEDSWSKVIIGANTYPWLWDTQLAAHILDNRRNITGLKFQVYANFGDIGYEENIKPFLSSIDPSKGSNGMNRVFEAPQEDLLIYCGLDSMYTGRLAIKQMDKMGIMICD
jgi:uracil-DNA glycosylase family 4